MTHYYARAWVRGAQVYALHTNTVPIAADVFQEWSDHIIDAEIEGNFEDAGEVLPLASYGPDGLAISNHTITVTSTRPGIVFDLEAETAKAADQVRSARDYRLATEVDPVVMNPLRWADLTPTQQQAWADYRTALLNVPQQPGFPHEVVWPEKPA